MGLMQTIYDLARQFQSEFFSSPVSHLMLHTTTTKTFHRNENLLGPWLGGSWHCCARTISMMTDDWTHNKRYRRTLGALVIIKIQ